MTTFTDKAESSSHCTLGENKTVQACLAKKMINATFNHLLTAPTGAEATGVAESPDGKKLFGDIRQPGKNIPISYGDDCQQ